MGRGRSPEMTSSVSHLASAPAGESQGGVHGAASCSRRGTNHEMASIHCQGAAHPPQAQARRSGRRGRFTELGSRGAGAWSQALLRIPEVDGVKLSAGAHTAGATSALQTRSHAILTARPGAGHCYSSQFVNDESEVQRG